MEYFSHISSLSRELPRDCDRTFRTWSSLSTRPIVWSTNRWRVAISLELETNFLGVTQGIYTCDTSTSIRQEIHIELTAYLHFIEGVWIMCAATRLKHGSTLMETQFTFYRTMQIKGSAEKPRIHSKTICFSIAFKRRWDSAIPPTFLEKTTSTDGEARRRLALMIPSVVVPNCFFFFFYTEWQRFGCANAFVGFSLNISIALNHI